MTTLTLSKSVIYIDVVEAYRLDRYDNLASCPVESFPKVVEAYRLDRYDNFLIFFSGVGFTWL